MRLDLCCYSGIKIYPGHGKRMCRGDGKTLIFVNRKCARAVRMKRNPRNIRWTILYRRLHKKGYIYEKRKRRKKVNTLFTRGVVGMSVAEIIARRKETPEVRKMRQEKAISLAKERQRSLRKRIQMKIAAKSAEKGKGGKEKEKDKDEKKVKKPAAVIDKAAKPMQTKAPRVGGKR